MRAIRADNGAQLRLLDLQTVDTTLAQLGHRRRTLPEHGVIAKLQTRRSALASDLIAATSFGATDGSRPAILRQMGLP